jgi:hypothetical protein
MDRLIEETRLVPFSSGEFHVVLDHAFDPFYHTPV